MTAQNENTTVSAVAVLSRTEANQRLIDAEVAHAAQSAASASEDVTRAIVKAVIDLEAKSPEAFERVPFLVVYHNPFAVAPLSEEVFNGPNDRYVRLA